MGVLLLTTLITCSQMNSIVNRVLTHANLTLTQKTEIVEEFKKLIPSCPVEIKNK